MGNSATRKHSLYDRRGLTGLLKRQIGELIEYVLVIPDGEEYPMQRVFHHSSARHRDPMLDPVVGRIIKVLDPWVEDGLLYFTGISYQEEKV